MTHMVALLQMRPDQDRTKAGNGHQQGMQALASAVGMEIIRPPHVGESTASGRRPCKRRQQRGWDKPGDGWQDNRKR